MWENCHDYDREVEKQVGKPAKTALTNEQNAKRLENEAREIDLDRYGDSYVPADGFAALLREAAALMRERDGVRWGNMPGYKSRYIGIYRDTFMTIERVSGRELWEWNVGDEYGTAPTLDAAKQAAIAWVDAQEGK
jgi:hypothetical protein